MKKTWIWILVIVILIAGAVWATNTVTRNQIAKEAAEAAKDAQIVEMQQQINELTIAAETTAMPTTVPTATPVAYINTYDWGWNTEETKILLPGYVIAGDVTIEGIKYYDEGGVNEATLVLNQSTRGLAAFSEWGAGEFKFIDKNNSILNMVQDEFANGGDTDAKTVRVVIITDDNIKQLWYNSNLEIIRTK